MHVRQAKRKLGSQFAWICDSMTNDLKHALGDAPNSEFVIDPQGRIVRARRWSRPQQLRVDLEDLVGVVRPQTKIADLDLPRLSRPKTAERGVVPRVDLPGRMVPIKVQPLTEHENSEPFYVKLRAEVESSYFDDGSGSLYLGFFLDPLYKVHWNNQAEAIRFEIESAAGIRLSPHRGEGPKVEVDADADPREFLIDLSGKTAEPLALAVRYFACDDAETFCKPVTQRYLVSLQRDRDGGSRRATRGPRRREGRSPFAWITEMVPVLRVLDADGDGEISSQEIDSAPTALQKLDANGDGKLVREEMSPR